jgi:hypothetical protein
MVDKYFDHNGLKTMGPTNLDDSYLTVLTPAARREKAPNADLNIPGTQAQKLYVNRDPKYVYHPQLDCPRAAPARQRAPGSV